MEVQEHKDSNTLPNSPSNMQENLKHISGPTSSNSRARTSGNTAQARAGVRSLLYGEKGDLRQRSKGKGWNALHLQSCDQHCLPTKEREGCLSLWPSYAARCLVFVSLWRGGKEQISDAITQSHTHTNSHTNLQRSNLNRGPQGLLRRPIHEGERLSCRHAGEAEHGGRFRAQSAQQAELLMCRGGRFHEKPGL